MSDESPSVTLPPPLKGLTGRPGDAGPQGKVGPSVSSVTTPAFAIFQHDEPVCVCVCLLH